MKDTTRANSRANGRSLPRWAEDIVASKPELLTIDESAEILRCSTKTVRRRISAGLLSAIKHGNLIVIPRAAVIEFLVA